MEYVEKAEVEIAGIPSIPDGDWGLQLNILKICGYKMEQSLRQIEILEKNLRL